MTLDLKKLLHGSYEAEQLPQDFSENRDVADFAFNILNANGLLYEPVIDHHHLENRGKPPSWPDGRKFAVCLTHDVDFVSANSIIQAIRSFRSRLLRPTGIEELTANLGSTLIRIMQGVTRSSAVDPLHCYEKWLDIENEFGARSTFFFWPGWKAIEKRHHTDCNYELRDRVKFRGRFCTVAKMIGEIHRRGWEIGLHPSWYAYNSVKNLKKQKASLEKVIGQKIVSVRQHYLHYDIRTTPRIHQASGFKYDSTLGFNDNIGFRFGTCYPWHLYDLKSAEELSILEIPLIIQDTAMLNPKKGMRLDEKTAFAYVNLLSEKVKKVGGVLTLLWHTDTINKEQHWRLYQRTLKLLKEQGAWFASVKEIGDWWIEHGRPVR
jgi:peptidoglycan/xylan/chitin deacetylase (PgdA/CDA1 family)